MSLHRKKGFRAILPAVATALIASGVIGSEARALDGPAEWGASRTAALDSRAASARGDEGTRKGRVINVSPSGVATLGPAATLPILGKNVRARAAAAPKASTNVEEGVRVTRGAPARRFIAADVEASLSGAAPAPTRKIDTIIVYRECVRPRRLVTHGFAGVKRYNTAIGGFATDTFGFNSYRRYAPLPCSAWRRRSA